MTATRLLPGALLLAGCAPIEPGTIVPRDASFDVLVSDGCGPEARAPSLAIEVRYAGSRTRRFSVCCSDRDVLLERLGTLRRLACEGLAVEPATIGGLVLSSTVSEYSAKRAVTLEQGEGYVAFQCDAWLPQLMAKLEAETVCAPRSSAPLEVPPTSSTSAGPASSDELPPSSSPTPAPR
ncbi:MAG: hypothetical protein FJ095_18515 [Deltaproteobacteria bacterium]|nr:hypothetical protein [Deltaproteobacteria bacterium]